MADDVVARADASLEGGKCENWVALSSELRDEVVRLRECEDEWAESARRLQDRLTRQIEGNQARHARIIELEEGLRRIATAHATAQHLQEIARALLGEGT